MCLCVGEAWSHNVERLTKAHAVNIRGPVLESVQGNPSTPLRNHICQHEGFTEQKRHVGNGTQTAEARAINKDASFTTNVAFDCCKVKKGLSCRSSMSNESVSMRIT